MQGPTAPARASRGFSISPWCTWALSGRVPGERILRQVTELILAPEPHTEPPATTSGVYQLNSPCGKHRAPLACSHSQIQMDFALATGKSWQKRIQVFSPCSSWAWSERRGLATGKGGAQRELKAHRSSLAGEGLGSSTCAGPCLNPERFRSWLAMR